MKVFVDECVDWRFSRDIVGHEVKTARRKRLIPELLACIPGAKKGAVGYVGV